MIIYSVQIKIHASVIKKWEYWMQKQHIPDVMATKLFTKYHFLKDVKKPRTYIIQYEAENIENYKKYKKLFAKSLQADHDKVFKKNYQATRSILIKNNQL